VFGAFEVAISDNCLDGCARGDPIDVARHHPAVEFKGATLTALDIAEQPDGSWRTQRVVDVCALQKEEGMDLPASTRSLIPSGALDRRVPDILYADEALIRDMDEKVRAAYATPDAHWGYRFPIGGAFDAEGGSRRTALASTSAAACARI
jgi:archease protein family (MTH1598/TM1083)